MKSLTVGAVLLLGWSGANYAGVCYSQGKIFSKEEIGSQVLQLAIAQAQRNYARNLPGRFLYRKWHNEKIAWARYGNRKWPNSDLADRAAWASSENLPSYYTISDYFDFVDYDPPLQNSKAYIYPEFPIFTAAFYSIFADSDIALMNTRKGKRHYSSYDGSYRAVPVPFFYKITGYAQYLAFSEIGIRLRLKK